MKKEIAFFDFDGTITTKDTLLEFIKFSEGKLRFFLGFLLNSPYLVAYKLKLISNQLAKEKVLSFFFKGVSEKEFDDKCKAFSRDVLPALIRPKALEEINALKEKGCAVILVSASPENWIKEWAEEMQLQLIGSRLEIKNGLITGKLAGKNCHGQEKVTRILENHVLTEYHEIYAYGDTAGDKPMLQLGTKTFFKPFR